MRDKKSRMALEALPYTIETRQPSDEAMLDGVVQWAHSRRLLDLTESDMEELVAELQDSPKELTKEIA